MNKVLTDKVSFEFIRYANCWEDAEVLIEGLNSKPGSKILSIGSAGDNSFSLLSTDPEILVAIDINKTQLHLIELKKLCFKHFSHSETIAFLGFRECSRRIEMFHEIKAYLSSNAFKFWNERLSLIEKGIIHQGKFEQYFQFFSQKILKWIHTEKRINELLSIKSSSEQISFYNRHWNNRRWRLLFRIFFSRTIMGKFGRDPEFMKEVSVSVSKNIFSKAENHLKSCAAQTNFMLHYALKGSYGDLLPHYLWPENYDIIKANIDKLEIREGLAQHAGEEFGKFDAMNLSNIFEYMNPVLFQETTANLISMMKPEGKMAYWNLMVQRSMAEQFPQKAVHLSELSEKLTEKDKGFFYNRFIIDQIK